MAGQSKDANVAGQEKPSKPMLEPGRADLRTGTRPVVERRARHSGGMCSCSHMLLSRMLLSWYR